MTRSEALDVRMTGLETEMRKVRSEINLNFEVMSKRMAELFEAMCHKLDKLPTDATSPPTGCSGIGNGALMESGRQESPRNLSEELLEEEESERESLGSDEARDVKEEDKVNEVEADIILNGALQLPDNLSEEESGESQTVEDAGGWTEKLILDDGGKLQRKEEGMELVNELERMVKAAAREGQPAYWFLLGLGKAENFEPVFVLVKDGGKFGFKCEPDPDFLGPPPWPNNFPECSIIKPNGKQHEYGLKCVRIGPFHQLNQPMIFSTEIEDGFGLVSQFLKYGPEVDASVGGTIDLNLLKATEGFTLCQSKHNNQKSSTQMCAAPARPPPQPPDFPWLVSRGKKHASSDDPGDLRVFWPALSFRFKHHLAGKAVLKGAARLSITPRESEEVGFVLLPPPEPPPLLVADWGWTCIALVADKYGARYDSRGNQMSTNRLSQLIGASWESYVDGLYLVLHPALFIAQLSHFVNAATSIFYHSPRPPDASCSYIQP